jgi:hypothetical protein
MLKTKARAFRYQVHNLVDVELDVARCGRWGGRVIDSKLRAFSTNGFGTNGHGATGNGAVRAGLAMPDIAMHVGPFDPQIPNGSVIVDKDFYCAPDYIYFRGHYGAGATEIRGLVGPRTTIRHAPGGGWLSNGAREALRAVNLYLEPMLRQRLLLLDPPVWLMHGGAVARDGRAIVLYGPNGSFKTQLILDLCLRHGFEFLGDDLVMLREGQALSFVEHPAVLAARAEAVAAGRPAKAGLWRLARHLLGNSNSTPGALKIAAPARVTAIVAMERCCEAVEPVDGADRTCVRLEACAASAVWKRAMALDRFELVKHQRRYRQIVNFARFAMAYEYAFPGSRLFALSLGPTGPAPAWLANTSAAICQMPQRYDPRAGGLLADFWRTGGESR